MRENDHIVHECVNTECRLPRRHEGQCDVRPPVIIDYTNWKGKRRKRKVSPLQMSRMACPPWHPEEELLLGAIDHEDGKHKFFPLRNIHSWIEEK